MIGETLEVRQVRLEEFDAIRPFAVCQTLLGPSTQGYTYDL